MSTINFFKVLYRYNKFYFTVGLIIIGLLLIGCTSSGGGSAPPPSGPIGGGCGG